MDIHNFEKGISKVFVTRGKDYYKRGLVRELHQIAMNAWRGEVSGSDYYDIYVELEGTNVKKSFCTCPFDGIHCKHEVAVYFAIRENLTQLPTIDRTINLLKNQSQEQLVTLFQQLIESNPTIQRPLQKLLTPEKNEELPIFTIDRAREIILSSLQPYLRSGWIDDDDFDKAFLGLHQVIDHAREAEIDGDYERSLALFLLCDDIVMDVRDICGEWLLEELETDIFLFISELLEDSKDEATALALLQQLKTNILKSLNEGLSRDYFGILRAALALTETQAAAIFYENLLQELANEPNLEELVEQLTFLFVMKNGTSEQRQYYFERHNLSNPLRDLMIGYTVDQKLYEEALVLCADGLDLPTINNQYKSNWQEAAYRIHQLLGNTVAQRAIAFELVVGGGYYTYYDDLKAITDDEEWPGLLEHLLVSIEEQRSRPYFYVELLVAEQQWERLLHVCHEQHERIVEYGVDLQPFYPAEVEALFMSHLTEKFECVSNRSHYKSLASDLRVFKKLGYKERTQQLITLFKARYPKRSALHEELSLI